MKRRKLFWGGFVDGKLDTLTVDMGWGGFGNGDKVDIPAVFKTKADARDKFQDVRRVAILPSPRQKRKP